MKFLAVTLMISTVVFAAPTAQKKTLPVTKAEAQVKGDKAKAALGKKEEEDCDEKARKPIEIKAETISLGGNTGCTLE